MQPSYLVHQSIAPCDWHWLIDPTLDLHGSFGHSKDQRFERLQRLVNQSGLLETTMAQLVSQTEHKVLLDSSLWQKDLLASLPHHKLGLVIEATTEPAALFDLIEQSGRMPAVIAIDIPAFTDGRCYSLAELLKRELWWQGELMVIGEVLQDQIFWFWRCGFDLIVPRHDQNIQLCQQSLQTFSSSYQASARDLKSM